MIETIIKKDVVLYKSEIFGKRLREAREYRGYSQKRIADLLGIQNASYGKYELGERELNASILPIIANFEEIDINFYFDEEINIKDADIRLKKSNKDIKTLTREIQEIKQQLSGSYIKSKTLSNIVDSLNKIDEESLSRFEYIVNAFIQSEQNKNDDNQKKRNTS